VHVEQADGAGSDARAGVILEGEDVDQAEDGGTRGGGKDRLEHLVVPVADGGVELADLESGRDGRAKRGGEGVGEWGKVGRLRKGSGLGGGRVTRKAVGPRADKADGECWGEGKGRELRCGEAIPRGMRIHPSCCYLYPCAAHTPARLAAHTIPPRATHTPRPRYAYPILPCCSSRERGYG
jgi:hypothetical protein